MKPMNHTNNQHGQNYLNVQMYSSGTHLVETNSCLTGLKTCSIGANSCLVQDTNPGAVVYDGNGVSYKAITATLQRCSKVKLLDHYQLPLAFILDV